ncbi:MAG: insulinase family protein [Holosporales bacterium]|jgi:zinc protease|nr:insulinase family protein [Holosporales bacterium]
MLTMKANTIFSAGWLFICCSSVCGTVEMTASSDEEGKSMTDQNDLTEEGKEANETKGKRNSKQKNASPPSSPTPASQADTPLKQNANKAAIPEFNVEIHEHKLEGLNDIWFIPSSKELVVIEICFENAGAKNVTATHPSLASLVPPMVGRGPCGMSDRDFKVALYECSSVQHLDIGNDHVSCVVAAPQDSYKKALELYMQALTNPKLPKRYLSQLKKDEVMQCTEALSSPGTHAGDAARTVLYDAKHPYRVLTKDVIKDIPTVSVRDTREFLEFLGQKNAYVVVMGPRSQEKEIVANVEKELRRLPVKGRPTISSKFELNANRKDLHVDFDVPQTNLIAVQRGFDRKDPDYFAKKLAFAVVAQGSLNAMLFQEIREKRGLAYACYGYNNELVLGPVIYIHVGTQNEKVPQAKAAVLELLNTVSKKGIPQRNFETVKSEVTGALVVNLDSGAKVVDFVIGKRVQGFSAEEVRTYGRNFGEVTYEAANKASKTLFDVDHLNFISVGKSVEGSHAK